jgi:hypothetical protein
MIIKGRFRMVAGLGRTESLRESGFVGVLKDLQGVIVKTLSGLYQATGRRTI